MGRLGEAGHYLIPLPPLKTEFISLYGGSRGDIIELRRWVLDENKVARRQREEGHRLQRGSQWELQARWCHRPSSEASNVGIEPLGILQVAEASDMQPNVRSSYGANAIAYCARGCSDYTGACRCKIRRTTSSTARDRSLVCAKSMIFARIRSAVRSTWRLAGTGGGGSDTAGVMRRKVMMGGVWSEMKFFV